MMGFLRYWLIGIFLVAANLQSNRCDSVPLSLSLYVSPESRESLKRAFEDAWKFDDPATVHYGVEGYIILNEEFPVSEQILCDYVNKIKLDAGSLEVAYHASGILQALPKCNAKSLQNEINQVVKKDKSSLAVDELYYLISTLKNLNANNTKEFSQIFSSLNNRLKSDDSLSNVAYAFHIASAVPNAENIEKYYEKIKPTILKADEVEGKYLQFEGGLSLTSMVIAGIYKLSETVNKAPPLTNGQALKFVNYFLNRLTVTRSRGAFGLLQVLSILVNNKFHSFVSVGVRGPPVVSSEDPVLSVRISDILGQPLASKPNAFTAKVETGARAGSIQLEETADRKTFTFHKDKISGIGTGFYEFEVTVSPPSGGIDDKTVVNPKNIIKFKSVADIQTENVYIGTVDTEQSPTDSLLQKVEFPSTLDEPLSFEHHQKFAFKFSVKDRDYQKLEKVDQTFVKFINEDTKDEFIFTCQYHSGQYRFTLEPFTVQSTPSFSAGKYVVVLIVGDVFARNSLRWPLANLNIVFQTESSAREREDEYTAYYSPKPKIEHLFKQPERRPPTIVSNVFTGIVMAPLLILFILWGKLGANVKNFPFTLSALLFHSSLGAIFVLFGIFWLHLDMFQTIKYLLIIGTVTFLSGHRMLSAIASKTAAKHSKKQN